MSLWVDKYRPSSIDKLDYHEALSSKLKLLSKSTDIPHLLFAGPSGAGKKTRILAILREMYGNGVEKLKIDVKSFLAPSGRKLEINVISSNYHIELNPSDVGIYDRVVVQEVIKEIGQTQQIDSNAARPFKVVLIHEADSLTKDAQHALRRTMEKYVKNLRIILSCTSISKIISPIRSRCLLVRVAAPAESEIAEVIEQIAKKENLKVPPALTQRIVEKSDRNMRKALLLFEGAKVKQYPFTENQVIDPIEWESFIGKVAMSILEEQSPARLLQVRAKFYELLTHCIPANVIFKVLLNELLKNVDDAMKVKFCQYAASYEHRMQNGNKEIYHLEAFVAKIMSTYKQYLMDIYI